MGIILGSIDSLKSEKVFFQNDFKSERSFSNIVKFYIIIYRGMKFTKLKN
jgi:hypothetical protein